MDLENPLISQAIFFPTRQPCPDALLVPLPGGGNLACARGALKPGAGTVIYWHGNGETAPMSADFLGELFDEWGVNVVFAEYRGYGASDGTPQLVAMLDDVDRIIEAAGVEDERLAFFGRSLGSLYAVEAAARHPNAAGLILESGIADPVDLLRRRLPLLSNLTAIAGLEASARRSFDQRAKLAKYPGPVLVLHTERDEIVDRSQGDRLYEWAAGPVKELCMFPKGGHNNILSVNSREYRDRVGAFLSKISLAS
ncbi:MAG: alpha/beta hydrolase [Isosphaeraceae bacterium]